MKIVRTIVSHKSQAQTDKFFVDYFRTNGYYQVNVKEGLKFKTYPKGGDVLGPTRFSPEIKINYFPTSNEQKIVVEIEVDNNKFEVGHQAELTGLDKEMYENFAKHFLAAFEEEKVSVFDVSEYVKQGGAFNKPYKIAVVTGTVLLILLTIILWDKMDTNYLLYGYFMMLALATFYAKWAVGKNTAKA